MTTTTKDLQGAPLTQGPGGDKKGSAKPADIVRRVYPQTKTGRK